MGGASKRFRQKKQNMPEQTEKGASKSKCMECGVEESAEEEAAGRRGPVRGQNWPLGTGALKQKSTMRLQFGKTSFSNMFTFFFFFFFEREDKKMLITFIVSLFLFFLDCQTLQQHNYFPKRFSKFVNV